MYICQWLFISGSFRWRNDKTGKLISKYSESLFDRAVIHIASVSKFIRISACYYKFDITWRTHKHLRNKFNFSEVHGSMNATCHVQKEWRPKGVTLTLHGTSGVTYFARDPLRSYFHEPQKNEIHLLHLHFVFTSFLFITCGILI